MEFFIMKSSPLSILTSFDPKYSPQDSFFKDPQPAILA